MSLALAPNTPDVPLDTIVHGDCMEGLAQLPDGCARLIVADPPYNLDKDFGPWKERERREQWLPWCRSWLDECMRVLCEGGSLFLHGIHHHMCWLQCHLHDQGMTYRRQVIWHYENGFAGYSKRTLAAHYDPILGFTRGDGYTYHPIREPYKSTERLKYKVIKNGKVWRPHPDGRLAGDVWKFPVLAGRRFAAERVDHPTQKPLSLARRIVTHFSSPGELVVVPFVGSGTECVAAAEADRRFVGFELNAEYVDLARQRIVDILAEQT
ncbi:MAG: site-specific DNA-methyltransferase [Myxococcota bacterium]|nr:site-specific DNA-methyltransferase [Myxococcota bacterium]